MEYRFKNLIINSNLEIRVLDEFDNDIDLIVNLDSRVVNIYLNSMPNYLLDRFQLTEVKAILIRVSKIGGNDTATVHFFRVIDLNSSLLNFSFDYGEMFLEILEGEYAVDFRIRKKQIS